MYARCKSKGSTSQSVCYQIVHLKGHLTHVDEGSQSISGRSHPPPNAAYCYVKCQTAADEPFLCKIKVRQLLPPDMQFEILKQAEFHIVFFYDEAGLGTR